MRGTPHPALRSVVARDYAGYTDATEPSGGFVLPATTSVIVVVKVQDSALRPPQFVAGAHGSFSVVNGACAPAYLEAWLSPLGAYALLRAPMDELGGFVDLGDLTGRDGRRLGDAVRGVATWSERFAAFDEFLLQRIDDAPAAAPEVRWAWRRLVRSGGAVPIGALAREVGWSHKHLITKFRQQVGLAPKTAARLVRFEQVWRRLGHGGPAHWDRIAADGGYADQSHLIRDFREFTGGSPAEFLARSIPAAPPAGTA
ncbi:MAG TPA: helix-turn-helix domain-containing protein [Streptosporangiaceae bacterium]|nr:helix-turn-helix domain-containing protein [Streptosporangiaceae bacterium]